MAELKLDLSRVDQALSSDDAEREDGGREGGGVGEEGGGMCDLDPLTDMYENLPPLEKLERYFQSEDVLDREVAVRCIAEAVEVATTYPEYQLILEISITLANDHEPNIRILILDSVSILLHHHSRLCHVDSENGIENKERLFDVPIRMVSDISQQVRRISQSCVIALLEDLTQDRDMLLTQLLPEMVRCLRKDEHYDLRMDMAMMLSRLAPLLGQQVLVRHFVPIFPSLGNDAMFHVRKAFAMGCRDICPVLGEELTETHILKPFLDLCQDDVWGVRKACADVFADVSNCCNLGTRHDRLTPRFLRLLQDDSRWVRKAAFEHLGSFIATFYVPNDSPDSFPCNDSSINPFGDSILMDNSLLSSHEEDGVWVGGPEPQKEQGETPSETRMSDSSTGMENQLEEGVESSKKSNEPFFYFMHTPLSATGKVTDVESQETEGEREGEREMERGGEREVGSEGEKEVEKENSGKRESTQVLELSVNEVSSDPRLVPEEPVAVSDETSEVCPLSSAMQRLALNVREEALNERGAPCNEETNEVVVEAVSEGDRLSEDGGSVDRVRAEDGATTNDRASDTTTTPESQETQGEEVAEISAEEVEVKVEEGAGDGRNDEGEVNVTQAEGGGSGESGECSAEEVNVTQAEDGGSGECGEEEVNVTQAEDGGSGESGECGEEEVNVTQAEDGESGECGEEEVNVTQAEDGGSGESGECSEEEVNVTQAEDGGSGENRECGEEDVNVTQTEGGESGECGGDSGDTRGEEVEGGSQRTNVTPEVGGETEGGVDTGSGLGHETGMKSEEQQGREREGECRAPHTPHNFPPIRVLVHTTAGHVMEPNCDPPDDTTTTPHERTSLHDNVVSMDMTLATVSDTSLHRDITIDPFTEEMQPQEIVPDELMEHYLSMTDASKSQTVDSDLPFYCAYCLPGVVLTLGPENWAVLRTTFFALSGDLQWKIRRVLAYSLHELAHILGSQTTITDLFPTFEEYCTKDVDDVKIGALSHLTEFFEVLPLSLRHSCLPTILEGLQEVENPKNWRYRHILVEQLVSLCDFYDADYLHSHIYPVARRLVEDRVAQVRHSATQLLGMILQRLTQITPDGYLPLLREMKSAYSAHQQWNFRQLYITQCRTYLAMRCISSEVFMSECLPSLLSLVSDKVPNVRLALAKTIREILSDRDYFQTDKQHALDQLESVLTTLQTDRDRDVVYFAGGDVSLFARPHPFTDSRYRTLSQVSEDQYHDAVDTLEGGKSVSEHEAWLRSWEEALSGPTLQMTGEIR